MGTEGQARTLLTACPEDEESGEDQLFTRTLESSDHGSGKSLLEPGWTDRGQRVINASQLKSPEVLRRVMGEDEGLGELISRRLITDRDTLQRN